MAFSQLVPRLLFAAGLTVWLPMLRAGEAPVFPTKIVMTEADCREINEKHSLRGRHVGGRVEWNPAKATWSGARVFTGKKRDIIGWFRTFPQRTAQRFMGGDQYGSLYHLANYQYDLLCSALLQTKDADIRRAVLWNYVGFGTCYLKPDWEALLSDPALSASDDRLAVGMRAIHAYEPDRWPKAFWERFADHTRPEDIVAVHMELRGWNPNGFSWSVFGPQHAPYDKAKRLLAPLTSREYVEARRPEGTHSRCVPDFAAAMLGAYRDLARDDLQRILADMLAHPDLWGRCATDILRWFPAKYVGDDQARMLRSLAIESRFPWLTPAVLSTYLFTPAGGRELRSDGGKALLEALLRAGFSKKEDSERVQHLASLVATQDGRSAVLLVLRRNRVRLDLKAWELRVLERAWHDFPTALDLLDAKRGK